MVQKVPTFFSAPAAAGTKEPFCGCRDLPITRHARHQNGSRALAWTWNGGVRWRGTRRYAWAARGARGVRTCP